MKILYKDKDIIVCIKPYGIPTQADKTHDEDMVSKLKNYIVEKENVKSEPEIYVVHRLDRPVSGVMVFARNKSSANKLSEQIKNRQFEKNYQAILTGKLKQEQGTLVDYLLKDSKTNTVKIVDKDTKDSKKAELNYEVLDCLETDEGIISYVLIELITGRHHQIRAQFSNQDAGIWGDTKYNKIFNKTKRIYRQIGLFCSRIAFVHPHNNKKMVFKEEPEGEAFDILDAQEF